MHQKNIDWYCLRVTSNYIPHGIYVSSYTLAIFSYLYICIYRPTIYETSTHIYKIVSVQYHICVYTQVTQVNNMTHATTSVGVHDSNEVV